ncbi:hypothetical protein [Actinophytocola xinjiangensis]|uniref:hypothetical protein n=1 Tax=Actinophytocola xinjiangensis TaxID=485602 RepID=UPI000AEF80DC|nr:hypothetical protein [Actinophytocola xinjiangensis]
MLAKQTNIPELRDLAREVLSGRVNLRGALNDPRATTVLQEQSERFSTWYRELSVDERTEHENEAEQFAKDASSFAPGPEPTGIRRRPHTEEDDDEEPSTIFR